MTNPAVSVDQLVVRYGEREALRGISFDVERGTVFGLLGPNGGGKTTLFRVLCTLLRADAGQAKVFGLDVASEALAVRRRMSNGKRHHRFPLRFQSRLRWPRPTQCLIVQWHRSIQADWTIRARASFGVATPKTAKLSTSQKH